MKAYLLPRFERMLQNASQQRKCVFYQTLVFTVTFITYVLYHMNKRPFSVVKGVLSPNCNVTTANCYPWAPFSNHKKDAKTFSFLDFTFMISYSLSLFVSGHIAENTNLRIFLSLGMIMVGVSSTLGGLAKYLHIHWLPYFFLVEMLAGMTQSTGFPCVTEAVGMWFPAGRRGITYGIWSLHTFIGNIVGSAIAGRFATTDWALSFMVPGIIISCFAVVVLLVLVPDPNIVNIQTEYSASSINQSDCLHPLLNDNQEKSIGISVWSAWKIPGVTEFALSAFFNKLVLYTYFFWLPYFIQSITIEGKQFSGSQAAYYSILFDVGSGFGGILAGVILDYTDAPAIICLIMLIVTAPCIIMFMVRLSTISLFLLFMFLTGCFLTGPFTLITTMVPAKLDSHERLKKNTKSIAVLSAIFDSCGSAGAAIGPLLTGVIVSAKSWNMVAYMLMVFVLFGAVSIIRQCYNEIIFIRSKYQKEKPCNNERSDKDETSRLFGHTDELDE